MGMSMVGKGSGNKRKGSGGISSNALTFCAKVGDAA